MKTDLDLPSIRALYKLFVPKKLRDQRQAEIDKQEAGVNFHFEQKMAALKAAWDAAYEGSDYLGWIRAKHNHDLQECIAQGTGYVSIMACGKGGRYCEACSELDGKVFRAEDEARSPHLPVANCSCTGDQDQQTGFCLCLYNPAFEDEFEQQQ